MLRLKRRSGQRGGDGRGGLLRGEHVVRRRGRGRARRAERVGAQRGRQGLRELVALELSPDQLHRDAELVFAELPVRVVVRERPVCTAGVKLLLTAVFCSILLCSDATTPNMSRGRFSSAPFRSPGYQHKTNK